MGSVYNKREEQRLRYRWYLKFANGPGETTLTGQMFDISSRGMAFLCPCDDNCPEPDELISTRFGVPRFDSGDSFDLVFFNRIGRVCRVDDLSSRVRRVAIQFARPLFFKPGEQDISESEAQRRLNAQKDARTEAERRMRAETEDKTRFYIKTIGRLKDGLVAERAARLKAEEEAQANSAITIKAQEQAAADAAARAQAQQRLRSEIEARIEAEKQLQVAIGEQSRIKAEAAKERAAFKSEMSEAIRAAKSEAQREAGSHVETINRLKDELAVERAARLKAEEEAQTNSAVTVKAQEQAAPEAPPRAQAERTAETEARAQAQQRLRSEIEARAKAEERLQVAIEEQSRIKAQAAKEVSDIKSRMLFKEMRRLRT